MAFKQYLCPCDDRRGKKARIMKIAIVSNQQKTLITIKKRFKNLKLQFVDIFTFSNVVEMDCSCILFDLILLNIDMSKINGLDYAKNNRDKKIVFICDNDKYIKQAFGPNIYGYIENGESDIDFKTTIFQSLDEITKDKIIVLKLKNGIQKFIIKDIVYLQYLGNRNVGFVYRNASYITIGIHLKNLKEVLGEKYIYIDRSTLVNMNHILGISNENLLLENMATQFKISKKKIKEIRDIII